MSFLPTPSIRRATPVASRLGGVVFGMAMLFAAVGQAAPPWAETPYGYVVLDQDIRATLTDFGRNLGLAVSLSDTVGGQVRGRIEADTAGAFLDRIADANGLNWYFDGAVLHVSTAGEYATRVIATEGVDSASVLPEMQRLGLADERFDLRSDSNGGVISVSGPPAYVAMVREFVQNMQPRMAVADGDDPRVRVYRGRVGHDEVTTPQPRE